MWYPEGGSDAQGKFEKNRNIEFAGEGAYGRKTEIQCAEKTEKDTMTGNGYFLIQQ